MLDDRFTTVITNLAYVYVPIKEGCFCPRHPIQAAANQVPKISTADMRYCDIVLRPNLALEDSGRVTFGNLQQCRTISAASAIAFGKDAITSEHSRNFAGFKKLRHNARFEKGLEIACVAEGDIGAYQA